MITQEDLGGILSRLAMADDAVLALILNAARQADKDLLPGDLEKLQHWARLMQSLRAVVCRQTNKGEAG